MHSQDAWSDFLSPLNTAGVGSSQSLIRIRLPNEAASVGRTENTDLVADSPSNKM